MRMMRTVIEIHASAERAWEVLTEFASHSEWNPFIITASGTLAVGHQLSFVIQRSPSRLISCRPSVLLLEPHRELR